MRYSSLSNASLQKVIAHSLPAAQAAGCFSALEGLSGGSLRFKAGEREYVARHQLASSMPGVSLKRQYRALKRLPAGIGPAPVCLADGWLIVEWLAGEVKSEPVSPDRLGPVLYHLHRQRRFGWRISLLPLLEYYWQHASPARRSPLWLRWLKQMKRRGEPKPLRLAPVHMDVHAGNLVHQQNEIRLIDWEYAGDGDIALELAAVITANNIDGGELLHAYANLSNIAPETLQRQVHRWRPWVMMLMASWYECRWRQTQDRTFLTLADEAWSLLRATNQ
ncbi:thiamine kinase [Dryocola sp. BD613]|uniref:thiamine kinase n=1 Tax=Dryocola sp. BD613 TaxID=3133272 RepID=UPI003F4F61D4